MDTEDYADYIPMAQQEMVAPSTASRNRPAGRSRRNLRDAPVDSPEAGQRLPLGTRALLWATLAICVALMVATAGETWQRIGIERQAAQARAQNTAIQRDTTQTQHDIIGAESPDTIEREARAWGYVRPGDTPVLVVPSPR